MALVQTQILLEVVLVVFSRNVALVNIHRGRNRGGLKHTKRNGTRWDGYRRGLGRQLGFASRIPINFSNGCRSVLVKYHGNCSGPPDSAKGKQMSLRGANSAF